MADLVSQIPVEVVVSGGKVRVTQIPVEILVQHQPVTHVAVTQVAVEVLGPWKLPEPTPGTLFLSDGTIWYRVGH